MMQMTQPQLSFRPGSPHNPQHMMPMTIPSPHSTVQSQLAQQVPYQQFATSQKYNDEILDPEIQQDEELSIDNKLFLNKISIYAGVLMIISSLVLFFIVISKIDSADHPFIYYTYKFFMYLGIGMIVISILSLANSFLNSGKITKGKSQSIFGKFVHFCCSLMLGYQFTVIFLCFLLIKVAPQVWTQDFLNSYWYTLFLCQLVFICSILFILHQTFQLNRRPATARIMVYLLLNCLLLVGFWLLCQVKTVLDLIKIHNVTDLISRDLLISIIVIILIAFILFVILLLVNYFKSGVWMFYFGTIIIILLLVFVNISGVIYRQALDLEKNYHQKESLKCYFSLDLINQDLIKKYQCAKYTEVQSSPYLSCKPNRQFIMWEPEANTALENRVNKRVCLNDKCCEGASLIIIKEILGIVMLNFFFCYCLLLIAIYCFYLIEKHKYEKSLQRPLEFLFFLVFICLSIVLIILISNKAARINDVRDYIILAEQIEIKKEKIQNVYLANDFLHNEKCSKFLDKLQALQKQFNPVSVSSDKWLRVYMLTEQIEIQVNQLFNEEELQILKSSQKSVIEKFFNVLRNDYHFLLVQGEREKVISFLQTQVYLCSLTSNTQIQLIQINSHEIDKNTLAIAQQINIHSSQEHQIELEHISEYNNNQHKLITPQLTGGGQFTELTIDVLSFPDSKPLEGVVVDLSKVLINNECPETLPDNQIIYKAVTNSKGQAKFNNIQQNIYFIHYSKPGYHSNCFSIGSSEVDELTLGMIKNLEDNQIGIMVTYQRMTEDNPSLNTFNNFFQLNLHGAFSQEGKECIIGSGFSDCGGMKQQQLSKVKKVSQTTASLLTLTLSNQNYLFYLKNIIEKRDYDALSSSQKNQLNQLWHSRTISLSYFVSNNVNPAYFKAKLDIQLNEQKKKEDNLAYLLGCVKANKNNEFIQIDQYWIGHEIPKFPKKQDQQFPYSGYCEQYEYTGE